MSNITFRFNVGALPVTNRYDSPETSWRKSVQGKIHIPMDMPNKLVPWYWGHFFSIRVNLFLSVVSTLPLCNHEWRNGQTIFMHNILWPSNWGCEKPDRYKSSVHYWLFNALELRCSGRQYWPNTECVEYQLQWIHNLNYSVYSHLPEWFHKLFPATSKRKGMYILICACNYHNTYSQYPKVSTKCSLQLSKRHRRSQRISATQWWCRGQKLQPW